jgi:tetratricopeptide (TPR) repeat protein
VTLHFHLGNVYHKLGDKEAALKEFQTLAERAAVEDWAYSVLGNYQLELKDYAGAIRSYKEALEVKAYSEKMTLANLGLAYSLVEAEKFPDKEALAIHAFEDALNEKGGGNDIVHLHYGIALFHFKRYAAAIEQTELARVLQEGLPGDPPPFAEEARRNLGQIYLDAGNPKKAIEMYSSVVEHCELVEDAKILEFALQELNKLGKTDVNCGDDGVG